MTGRFQLRGTMETQARAREFSVFAQKNQRVYRQRALRRNPGGQETQQHHCHDNTS
jgi:hypothetical protein